MPAIRACLPFALLIPALASSLNSSRCSAEPCAGTCYVHVKWEGIYSTVLAPWKCCEGGVDEESLAMQVRYQLFGKVHGLLVLGTIGEGEYATMEERARIITVCVREAKGCVPVVAGIHTCDVEKAKAQLVQAKELGAAAVLIKYSGRPGASGDEVLGFFAQLSQLNLLPIFYYHYPSQTGLHLVPSQIAQILSLPGVVGIKESTLDLKETAAHIALTHGQGKAFLSGTALNLTQFMEKGGHGAMCPEAVFMPGTTVCAWQAFADGDIEGARERQKKLFVIAPLLRSGPGGERGARTITMCAQDHCIAMPMGNEHPQARLKCALNGIGIPTAPFVKCPLPGLGHQDKRKVCDFVGSMKDCAHCITPWWVRTHVPTAAPGTYQGSFKWNSLMPHEGR